MDKKTFIKGKDKDLEFSIASMQEKLSNIGINIQSVSAQNPVPYVYSQHINDADCTMMFTNGKGACEKSCLASAMGEFFERYSCNYFFADYYLGAEVSDGKFVHYPNEKWFVSEDDEMPEGLLDDSLWDFYDPESELHPSQVIDINSDVERGICGLPFERQSDKKTIYFPVNIIGNLYVSNGMSAGNTQNEARVQALCEIYERYAKNKIIAEGITLPLIPDEVLSRFPHIKESIQKLKDHGYSLRICDASLGGVYPVISVTLINPKDGSVFASFGSHPCFEVALERTVTELLQGRDLEIGDDFFAPSFNLDEVADDHNLEAHFINSSGLLHYDFFKETPTYKFVDWNHDSSTENEFNYLCKIAEDADKEIYITDYEHLGVYACRIIIPSMSEIYPVQDLLWSNNNEGAYYREPILSLDTLDNEDKLSIIQNLEEAEHNDMLKVAEFIGVIPDENTAWQSLTVGELKAMIYLCLGDKQNAKEWVVWCNVMAELNDERQNMYKCLDALLEIGLSGMPLDEYIPSLNLMYSEKLVQDCLEIIEQKQCFYGLHFTGLSLDGFTKHQKLLKAYAKAHKAKEENFKD